LLMRWDAVLEKPGQRWSVEVGVKDPVVAANTAFRMILEEQK